MSQPPSDELDRRPAEPGASYRRSGSVRDRDRLRGEHLWRLGWSFHRVWSTNWFRDPQSEVTKRQKAYQEALSAAAAREPAAPTPEPKAPPPEAAAWPPDQPRSGPSLQPRHPN